MKQQVVLFLVSFIFAKSFCLDQRPIITARSGNLEIAAAPGSNIRLNVTSGGKLLLQDTDISAMIQDMSSSLETLQQCSVDSKNALTKIAKFEGDIDSNSLMNRLSYLERFTNNTNRLVFLVSRPMRRRINGIQKRLSALTLALNTNECNSNPCQHGGTCQDLYNAYNCICPPNWEGGNCEKDVNECEKFRGTELGCQNDAKCVNSPGSYECKCTEGWYGLHCTKKTQDCNNSVEVCGHGTCVPLNNGYKCLCDQGWKTDGTKPACTVDINECDSYHPPCSSNPPVTCVNLPGTFYCGHCPAGYTGNGFYCSDINECEILNGGCSIYPMVQCLNVPGSRICGSCPPGYQGNGVSCTFQGVCAVGNGGCHPMAQCRDNPRISATYVECICPPGYGGDGYGPNGCIKGGFIDACASNPCQHGTCTSANNGYTCNCTSRYTGRNCDIRKDGCFSNPCQNGGTCKSVLFSYLCECAPGFSGPTCQNNVMQCGQALGKEGKLVYPPAELIFNRNSQISCAIRLQAPMTKVLNVTVHGVYLPVCSHNYFQIHDGKDTGSPLIGRFCNDKLNNGTNIISTTDTLYLWLKGDALAPKPFINISWNSIEPVCGSFIDITDPGTFKSPGSPQNYPENRDCYWKLKAPLNKRIKFTFYHLDIGNNSDCSKDFVSFNEGLEPSDKSFFKQCKSAIVEPIFSPSNEVTVHLHTVGSYTGFLIHYSLIDGIVGCGGIYTHTNGIIASNTNLMNSEEISCEYKIQLSFQTKIKLHFKSFKGVGESRLCTDKSFTLAVYEGDNFNSPLIGRYCGRNLPPDLLISESKLLIVYKPKESTKFELEYKTVCGGVFTEETATIQSDNYPNRITIDEPIECVYKILRPPNNRLEIIFNGFDIGNSSNWNCQFGQLNLEEDSKNPQRKLLKYCSIKPEESIYSDTNYVTITYIAKSGIVGGFSLTYKSIADSNCGGVRTDKFGTIESPRDLHTYENGLNCTWLLSAPAGYLIELNWLSFNLEDSYQCMYDYVQIFDNVTTEERGKSTEMGKFCGNRLPPTMTTTSNFATVFFKVDGLNNYDGFYLTYRYISVTNVCGGHYFSPSGIIKSPLYPLPYPSNRNCIWIITAPTGQQIQLNFTSFQLEGSSGCRYDYLQILNGGFATSPAIGKFCGNKSPKLVYSHTNQLYVQFVSDKTTNANGFELRWTSTTTGCGGSLTAPSGTIISPNYPEPYGRNAECFWKIAVSSGSKVQVVFADLELEYLNGCYMDYISFFDGIDTMSPKLGTFCKIESSSPIVTSTKNHLTLKFHSDINYQGRGFQLQYSTMCRTNLTGFSGVIENPNFPNNSPKGQECEWQINVPTGNQINLTFSHFNIEHQKIDGADCNVFLEILYESTDTFEKTSLGKFCDGNPPDQEINIKSNIAFIKFNYNNMYLKASFRLEWTLSGCGGFLTRPSGTIQTPNYPNDYPLNTDCIWHIQTEFGKSIELTFDKIDMEQHRTCDVDNIQIFNGPDETYALLAKICHTNDKPIVITSTGRELFVTFHSDVSYTGKGFQAQYKSVDTKCGGKLSATSGTFHSPNYPKNYDLNDTCEWLIEVQENHLIELTFNSVDLLNVCDETFIKVYDGPTSAYPLLTKICGTITPEKITSNSNHLYVELVTHALLATKGFTASYTTACGARIKTQGSGIINFGLETLMTTEIGNCSWTIIADNPEEHVLLTFSKFQHANCYFNEVNAISIYDGENHNSSLIGGYCEKMPGIIRSSGNVLHLEIPAGIDRLKFSAKYSVLESSCGGSFSAQSGTFSSPNYPESYPVDIQCEWTISAGESNKVQLDFTTFDLIQSENCNEDYLEIREFNSSGRLIGHFCGGNKPINVTGFNGLWLYFKSERPDVGSNVQTGKGFLADFAIATSVEITGSNGTIVSPLYPERLISDQVYKWQITVPGNYVISFEFDDMDFDMGNPDYCYGSALMIIDGSSEDDSLIQQICTKSKAVKTTQNEALLRLTDSSYGRGSKFKLRWKQVHLTNATNSNCTGEDSDESVLIQNEEITLTNEFQAGSIGRKKCSWHYNTIPGRHLRIVFTEILSSSSFCIVDSINLLDGSHQSKWAMNFKSMAIVCNASYTNRSYETTEDALTVRHSVFFYGQARNRTSKFSLNITDVCGGNIKKSNGYIIVDGLKEPKTGRLLECKWQITVTIGKIIQLYLVGNFTHNSATACGTKAIVRNGHNSESPIVLTHCGNPPSQTITTTGNKAFITFTGNYTDSLKIKFREASTTECGSTIELTNVDNSMIISSPNYPNAPNLYAECIWLISVPNGEAIRVDFLERFDLQSYKDCKVDGVEIREGATSNSKLIDTFCETMPSTVRSLGNRMYIRYYTNSVDPRNGFKANISIAFCGGTIRGSKGTITSPGFKHKSSYPTNITCQWEFSTRSGRSLNITFNDFDLPKDAKLYIIDYDETPGQRFNRSFLYNYAGRKPTKVVQSGSSKVLVKFQSGKGGSFNGFKITYEASFEVCGGEYNTPSGTITSPHYPQATKLKQTCEWTITVPKGRRVKLEFLDLDLTRPMGSSQGIACFSGDTFASNVLFLTDDNKYETTVRSSDNIMKIYYWSYSNEQSRGFKVRYTSDEASICSDSWMASDTKGRITRPSEEIFTCTWEPKPPMTTQQTLAYQIKTNFSGPVPNSCTFAQSAVFVTQSGLKRNVLTFYSDVLQQYCKTTREPDIIRTILPYSKISASQKNNKSSIDFDIKYQVHDCGGDINSPDGFISAPLLPSNAEFQTSSIECAWRLSGQQGEQFTITTNDFHLDDCDASYLLVYNGKSIKAPLVGKYCGSNKPPTIQSQRHFLWIEYHGNNKTSFNMTYSKSSKICGGIHHSQSSKLQTPSYPANYDNNMECLWELRAKNGYHIELQFNNRFQLEEADGCRNDFVTVYEEDIYETIAPKFCGRNLPPTLRSNGNLLFVLFRTNQMVTGSGFTATWRWVCGGSYNATDSAQVIESPGYPEMYSKNLRCEYLISAPGKYIKIAFEDFELETSSSCLYDRLLTRSRVNPMPHKKTAFCGDKLPNVMRFYGLANLTFITDTWVNKRGFKLNYQLDTCGGNVTEPTLLQDSSTQGATSAQIIYSPLRRCNWNILAPKNKRINIKFAQVNITYNIYCYSQFVSVMDDKGNKMAVLCGDLPNESLPTLHSNGNNVTVKFQYYNFGRPSFFSAFIDFVYGPETGCGGFVNLTTKTLETFNFQPPGNDYDCVWHVQTQTDYIIKINFDVKHINVDDKATKCNKIDNNIYATEKKDCCVFYEMRDGNTSLSDEIFSGCDLKGSMPVSFVSSGSFAHLRIVGKNKELKIPKITISRELSICGHLSLAPTNTSQFITTPNFPSSYPANLRCVWRIKSKFTHAIRLKFEEFDLNSNEKNISDCDSRDRLELVDRSNKAFHLNYDLVWKRKTSKWELSKLDSLFGQHTFCAKTDKNYEFVSTESLIQLSFFSDSTLPKHGKGFKIEYKIAECNRNYTGLSGRIARIWQPQNCTAYITVPQNYTIALFFQNMHQFQVGCTFRWLDIYDGSTSKTPVVKLCGMQQVKPIFSTTNELIIQLKNTMSYGMYTSEMTYIASDKGRGCGGELYMFKGSFTSPLYPNPTTSGILCRWNVRVPMGLQVAFNFKWLDIKGNCADNYVKIFDANQPEAGTQTYCSKDVPAVFIATSGILTLEYKSGPANTGTGWRAAFMAITSDFDLEKFKN